MVISLVSRCAIVIAIIAANVILNDVYYTWWDDLDNYANYHNYSNDISSLKMLIKDFYVLLSSRINNASCYYYNYNYYCHNYYYYCYNNYCYFTNTNGLFVV